MPNLSLDSLLTTIRGYTGAADVAAVRRAYALARGGNDAVTTVDSAVQRSLYVADRLAQLELDVDTIAAGLLLPAVDGGTVAVDDVRAAFGGDLAELVELAVQLSAVDVGRSVDTQAEAFRKLIFAMASDLRALLVRLADRSCRLRDVANSAPVKVQRDTARVALEIDAPVANRLGMQRLKTEIEDLAFALLHPEEHRRIGEYLATRRDATDELIEGRLGELRALLDDCCPSAQVYGRVKHRFGIFRKMRDRGVDVDEIRDIVAFRVVVDDVADCYTVQGHVLGRYDVRSAHNKDYISKPKSNGYQSLHSTLIGPDGQSFEVQIRTRAMHRVAEYGVAAHWRYKEGHLALSPAELERYTRAHDLSRMADEITDAHEFVELVKVDLFSEEVYVYTPTRDVRWFPRGATVLDFAYSIHTDVGFTCTGAQVGGQMVPLHHKLRSGDEVRILTRKDQQPRADWMRKVVTPRARSKIRTFLNTEEREKARERGREQLAAALAARDRKLKTLMAEREFAAALDDLGAHNADELFARIGYGQISVDKVLTRLLPEARSFGDGAQFVRPPRAARRARSPIRVQEIDSLLTTMAGCCKPVRGEPIIGYVTRGRGVTVHRADCRQVRKLDPERLLPVTWERSADAASAVEIRVTMVDRPSMLSSVLYKIGASRVNVTHCDASTDPDGMGTAVIGLSVADLGDLEEMVGSLSKLPGVLEVRRL